MMLDEAKKTFTCTFKCLQQQTFKMSFTCNAVFVHPCIATSTEVKDGNTSTTDGQTQEELLTIVLSLTSCIISFLFHEGAAASSEGNELFFMTNRKLFTCLLLNHCE